MNRFGNECGYNLTAGGDGLSGMKRSQTTKEKISKSLSGRTLTESHKKNLSQSKLESANRFNQTNKIIWPNDSDLLIMANNLGYMKAAKLLGVSNNAVKGRLRRRKLI